MKTKVQLRKATPADFPKILKLGAENGLAPASIDETPTSFGAEARMPDVNYVLETPSGEIVGSVGTYFAKYFLNGRELKVSCPTAWVVAPEHRTYSTMLIHKLLSEPGVDLVIHTTARPPADQVYLALKHKKMPVENFQQALFWILDRQGFFKSFLKKKNLGFLSSFSFLAEHGISVAEKLMGKTERRARLAGGLSIQWIKSFDIKFDVFWKELLQKKSKILLGSRDREALTQHFQRAIDQNRAWVATCEQAGRLVAYAVFFRQDHPGFGLKRIRLVDFQSICESDSQTADVLNQVIQRAVLLFRTHRFHMLEVVGFNGTVRTTLEKTAPYRRQLESWPYFYRSQIAGLELELAQPIVWEPTLFDGDASL